ncbi:unnamed protein product [Trichobilharzia szidati]|nr:unnamed protein product [Trichobilharzia szidati]
MTSIEVTSHPDSLKWENLSIETYTETQYTAHSLSNNLSPSLRQTQLNFSPSEVKISKRIKDGGLLTSLILEHADNLTSLNDIIAKTPIKQEPTTTLSSPRTLKQTTLTGAVSPLTEDAFKKPSRKKKAGTGATKKSQVKRSHSVDSSQPNARGINSRQTRNYKSSNVSPKKNIRLADKSVGVVVPSSFPPALTDIQPEKLVNSKNKLQYQTQLTSYGIRRTARQYAKEIERERENNFLLALKNNIEAGMKIIHTEDKGRGIIATRPFSEGEFVVEYAGDLIPEKLAKQREAEYKRDPNIGSYMFFFVHAGQRYCVDATKETPRLGRLINHSRLKPNCVVKVIPVDGIPRLALFARKPISPGEELLYDYGDRDKESLEAHPWLKT